LEYVGARLLKQTRISENWNSEARIRRARNSGQRRQVSIYYLIKAAQARGTLLRTAHVNVSVFRRIDSAGFNPPLTVRPNSTRPK
jgi:hypothetical protein